jgi:molybdopterin converting factor small subunit
MQVNLSFPYQFYLETQIVSLHMNIVEQDITYRRVLEILAKSFDDQVYQLIVSNHEIMVVIIVDNKCVNHDAQVHDGDKISLMLPLEGG